MNNRGQITVFLCLIITVLLTLGVMAFKICARYTAKEEGAIAVNSAVSDIKSGYNSYIFEHYHILLFDKTDYGCGEAYVEEEFGTYIDKNLEGDLSLGEVAITDYDLILDDNCAAFKAQIEEYMPYAAASYGADEILEKTGGKDAVMSDEVIHNMDAECENSDSDNTSNHGSGGEGENSDSDSDKDEDDPRDFTKDMGKTGVLYFVAPRDLSINEETVELTECPSQGFADFMSRFDVQSKFNSYSRLKKDLKNNTEWNSAIAEAGSALVYAKGVFNCATNLTVNEGTVFDFELEYIICGDKSDYKNLNKTVKRLIALRLPIDFTYLLTDTSRMARVKSIAASISASTGVPYSVVKYLISGCWAYVESVADVKLLLKGKKLPFDKSGSNWLTDIDNLGGSLDDADFEDEAGMDYEDYLMILMALNMDTAYLRMLDLMQLNARQIYPDFKMENAAVGLTAEVSLIYDGSEFDYRISGGY